MSRSYDAFVHRWDELATYNSECARGIVHTADWDAKMAHEQKVFNVEHQTEAHYLVHSGTGQLLGWGATEEEASAMAFAARKASATSGRGRR